MNKLETSYQTFLDANLYPRFLNQYEVVENNAPASRLYLDGKEYINFSSSDYLGLATHPLLIARSHEYTKKYGTGTGSSRLVTGNFSFFEAIEAQLAKALNKPTALILGTGYQTNQSVLEALLDKKILAHPPIVFCDKYIHTSIQNTCRYFAKLHRFKHNDLDHLEFLLQQAQSTPHTPFILAESVYSMDGDEVDLKRLTTLAKKYHAFLYIDDAHAVGIYGSTGFGHAVDYANDIDIVMGTFSKALGSFGGYIGCSEVVRNYLINKCKGLIYSTALPPSILGAISATIELLPSLEENRKRLHQHANRLRQFFHDNHLPCGNSTTHIIPWIIGDADKTIHIANNLKSNGILAAPIRPPSVSPHQSRIRFCLSAAHTNSDLEYLMTVIQQISV
jgi:8-amino-7-oxononanoate synthase